jgi:hypothetical protein
MYLYLLTYNICSCSIKNVVTQLFEALRYKPRVRGFDPRLAQWNFSLTLSSWPHYGRGVDEASYINEYQEYLLGVKAAGV